MNLEISSNNTPIEIISSKDQNADTVGKSTRHDSEQQLRNDNNISSTLSSFFSFDTLVHSSLKLIKTNDEYKYLMFFLFTWLIIVCFEFVYGFLETKVDIISDSFFNYFKTISFLIAGLSILMTRVYVFDSVFLKARIELIAALSNIIFLVIVSLYMCLQALHMITEDGHGNHNHTESHSHSSIHSHNNEDGSQIFFFKNFFIIKVILDVLALLVFSDYIIHPSLQIKLFLWKICKQWKKLHEVEIAKLKECKQLIRIWNSHFENMNALTVNIFSDLCTSILFMLSFYISKNTHYEEIYTMISIVNLVLIIILVKPLFQSILRILMQGKSELFECFYQQLHTVISYFEGCLGIKEMKFWMVSQNEIKGDIKVYGTSELNKAKLNEQIHKIVDDIDIHFDFTLEITN